MVPVAVGALSSKSKKLAGHLEQLGIQDLARTMQKLSLFGYAHNYPQKRVLSLRSRDET